MSGQLPLNISLREQLTFDNYTAGSNQQVVNRLSTLTADDSRAADDWLLYLWGPSGCGKTHLLQASCLQMDQADSSTLLVSLKSAADMKPAIFEDLGHVAAVYIDDVQYIAGMIEWETALFSLCEQRRIDHKLLVIAGDNNPKYLGLGLMDLTTRLAGWAAVFPLNVLDDNEKSELIKQRASSRGLDVADEVITYVLSRYPRNMQALFNLLEQVDYESLANQRRITIPFLRSLELDAGRESICFTK